MANKFWKTIASAGVGIALLDRSLETISSLNYTLRTESTNIQDSLGNIGSQITEKGILISAMLGAGYLTYLGTRATWNYMSNNKTILDKE